MNAHEKERNEMLSKIDEEKIKALKEQPARGLESKFKVGDRIQFKGFGHNKYTIAKVEGNRYVDTSGNGMDMSYTDANFELVKEQPVKVGDKVSIIKKKEGIVTRISDGKARVETGDTMEIVNLSDLVTEQPVCEDLKKRASEIYPNKEGDLCSLHSTLQRGGYIRGYQDCKEQMMKEAVEGDIGMILHDKTADLFVRSKGYLPKSLGIKCCDKVKLIIVKEDLLCTR